ncbi:Tegument antigen [Schistosoma japonicum]|uniref:Clone ZZD336 mRNA sequence n=1 Tax=Schistosoma japonicum TaxID=6182 RepID=Q86EI5_SCHJA|nr:similar to GenBank Accession Number U86673 tegumental antigen Sm20 [Schistosoma japonicum]KAH8849622.1 Tegument antigen [Schistosoma japonicum]KAH8849623.1 Tegument antigen [Schistosoma japonicum]KAH8849624.1 Tegument antigen [Schistosoma japonicum]TNN07562.1 Tegument antigen [Schistosoma japonicum]
MEPFVQVFFAIDKDETETISIDELKSYVAANNLDEMMVTKWQTLFDPNRTGKITFKKFCEVLGLSPAQAVAMKTQHQSATMKLHPDVTVIYEQLPLDKQIAISNKTIELAKSTKKLDEKDQAVQLKQWLDQTYGKAWHVVIVRGSFWSSYSHSANKCFMYRIYDFSYLVWRTPDEELTGE